ncbi:FtsK/SpoIIIE domain-containing protein [Gordonia sputi]|uniref:FtsK/SpoIIIE domain-containing protein n=1 Tax=Gordonia sputi TaxID=36823 RepID=UPI0036736E88
MSGLTAAEIERGRALLVVLREVWPRFCAEQRITRTSENIGGQLLAHGARILAPRNMFGSAMRLASGVGEAAAGPSTNVPELLRVWASPVGPTVAIAAGWIAADQLRSRLPLLEQELGCVMRVSSVGTELHLTLVVADPLSSMVGGEVPPPPADLERILLGRCENGEWALLPMRDRNGLTFGAEAGSGKTFGINALLAGWVQHDSVQVACVDGKAGPDYMWLEPRAQALLPTVDRQAVVEVLEPYRDELNRRTALLRSEFDRWRSAGAEGDAPPTSFWHVAARPDFPLIVIVVDECQVFLSGSKTKEDKAFETQLTSVLADLLNRGRSAGIFTILATQKSTTDSIPSVLRDKVTTRLVGRVSTAESVRAALGRMPVEGEPDPLRLPQRPGMVIVAPESGELVIARSWYVPPDELVRLGIRTAHLRRGLPESDGEEGGEVTDGRDDVQGAVAS